MNATVRGLFVCPEKKGKVLSRDEVRLNPNGLEGDFHNSTTSRRQVLLLSAEVLNEFGLAPGSLRENVVVDGLDVMNLPEGQFLHAGTAVLEITVPCEPCTQMERIRKGLKQALGGKRGMFAKVVTPGTIRVGDAVRLS